MANTAGFRRLSNIPEVRSILGRASQLALHDAAYELWQARYQLREHERRAGLFPLECASIEAGRRVGLRSIRSSYDEVATERATLQDGATFIWMKIAHPDATADMIRDALGLVLELQDAIGGLGGMMAMSHAREAFPMFSDTTLRAVQLEQSVADGYSAPERAR